MSEKLLAGRPLAEAMNARTAERAGAFADRCGRRVCLATVLVGDDPASATYVRMKGRACERLGMTSRKIFLAASASTAQVVDEIQALNEAPGVDGILVQHPVPNGIDERAAFEAVDPAKDVDGVTTQSFAHMSFGLDGFASCTPRAMMRLLSHYGIDVKGKHAVVIGRSPILGKPLSMLLLQSHATVTICHSRTRDVPGQVRRADIVAACVGKPKFVQGDWIKDGAVILDAGYNPGNVGDVNFDACLERCAHITPVPGGVGPVTIATLLEQTVDAAWDGRG